MFDSCCDTRTIDNHPIRCLPTSNHWVTGRYRPSINPAPNVCRSVLTQSHTFMSFYLLSCWVRYWISTGLKLPLFLRIFDGHWPYAHMANDECNQVWPHIFGSRRKSYEYPRLWQLHTHEDVVLGWYYDIVTWYVVRKIEQLKDIYHSDSLLRWECIVLRRRPWRRHLPISNEAKRNWRQMSNDVRALVNHKVPAKILQGRC